MAKTPIFTGSCTAIVTPYTDNGVDYAKYEELLEMQYEGGTSAILVCGTTGEKPHPHLRGAQQARRAHRKALRRTHEGHRRRGLQQHRACA